MEKGDLYLFFGFVAAFAFGAFLLAPQKDNSPTSQAVAHVVPGNTCTQAFVQDYPEYSKDSTVCRMSPTPGLSLRDNSYTNLCYCDVFKVSSKMRAHTDTPVITKIITVGFDLLDQTWTATTSHK